MIWIIFDYLTSGNGFKYLRQSDRFILHFFTSMVSNSYCSHRCQGLYLDKYSIRVHLTVPHSPSGLLRIYSNTV